MYILKPVIIFRFMLTCLQLQSTIAHSSAMMASMSSLLSSRRAFRRDSTDHPWQDIAYNVVVNEVLDLIAEDSSEDEESKEDEGKASSVWS